MIYATEQQVVVTSVAIVIVAVVALFLGMWWGVRRGLEQAAEEQHWKREQARTRRTHPVYRQPPNLDELPEFHLHDRSGPWLPPDETVLNPTAVLPPDTSPEDMSWTGEIQAMTAKFEQDMERLLGGSDETLLASFGRAAR